MSTLAFSLNAYTSLPLRVALRLLVDSANVALSLAALLALNEPVSTYDALSLAGELALKLPVSAKAALSLAELLAVRLLESLNVPVSLALLGVVLSAVYVTIRIV
jgi:hypothetical protein